VGRPPPPRAPGGGGGPPLSVPVSMQLYSYGDVTASSPVQSVVIVLQNSGEERYDYDALQGPASGNATQCYETTDGLPYSVNTSCANGFVRQLACPGDAAAEISYNCSGAGELPVCTLWNGTGFAAAAGCAVTAFDSGSTTCLCDGSAIEQLAFLLDRRRLQAGPANPQSYRFASTLRTVGAEFAATVLSVQGLSVADVRKNIVVFVTMGCFVLCTLLGVLALGRLDRRAIAGLAKQEKRDKAKKEETEAMAQRLKGGAGSPGRGKGKGKGGQGGGDNAHFSHLLELLEALLPVELGEDAWYSRWYRKMIEEVDFYVFFSDYDPTAPWARHEKWLFTALGFLNYMFIQAVLAVVIYPDDGACQEFLDRASCEADLSPTLLHSQCVWEQSDPLTSGCELNPPRSNIVELFLLAIFTEVAAVPLDRLVEVFLIARISASKHIFTGMTLFSSTTAPAPAPTPGRVAPDPGTPTQTQQTAPSTPLPEPKPKARSQRIPPFNMASNKVGVEELEEIDDVDEIEYGGGDRGGSGGGSSSRVAPSSALALAPAAAPQSVSSHPQRSGSGQAGAGTGTGGAEESPAPSAGELEAGLGARGSAVVAALEEQPCAFNYDFLYEDDRKKIAYDFLKRSLYLSFRQHRLGRLDALSARGEAEAVCAAALHTVQATAYETNLCTLAALRREFVKTRLRLDASGAASEPALAQLTAEIEHNRLVGEGISRTLLNMADEREKNLYLVRHFLIARLPRVLRHFAKKHFFRSDGRDFSGDPAWAAYLCVLLLALYFLGLTLYVLLFGVRYGPASTLSWMVGVSMNIGADILLIYPAKVFFFHILIPGIFIQEVQALLQHLKLRYTVILTRAKGLWTPSAALIQHLNPACRAARRHPDVPMARLLVCVSDLDMPLFAKLQTKSGAGDLLAYAGFAVLVGFLSLVFLFVPEVVEDIIVEMMVNALTPLLMLAFVFLMARIVYLPFVVLALGGIGLGVREELHRRRRERRRLRALTLAIHPELLRREVMGIGAQAGPGGQGGGGGGRGRGRDRKDRYSSAPVYVKCQATKAQQRAERDRARAAAEAAAARALARRRADEAAAAEEAEIRAGAAARVSAHTSSRRVAEQYSANQHAGYADMRVVFIA
jgi:hypothetical protein